MTGTAPNTAVTHPLSITQLLRHCAWYNATLGALIMGALALNPEIWVNDYPPDIKARYGPISPRSKRQALLVAVPFFAIMLGGLVWSNLKQKRRHNGVLPFKAAFLNAYALLLSGWLFDLTILDWLIFVRITPDFVVLPGTEGMAGYDDFGFHLREHLKALPMLAGFSLLIAAVTASRPWNHRQEAAFQD